MSRLQELQDKYRADTATEDEMAELEELQSDLHQAQKDAIPRLTCCEPNRRHPAAVFSVSVDDLDDEGVGLRGRWRVAYFDSVVLRDLAFYETMPEPKFCPYCAAPIPRMVRKTALPENLCKITDGGYYCDACGKRCNECLCLPPEAAFEPSP